MAPAAFLVLDVVFTFAAALKRLDWRASIERGRKLFLTKDKTLKAQRAPASPFGPLQTNLPSSAFWTHFLPNKHDLL